MQILTEDITFDVKIWHLMLELYFLRPISNIGFSLRSVSLVLVCQKRHETMEIGHLLYGDESSLYSTFAIEPSIWV